MDGTAEVECGEVEALKIHTVVEHVTQVPHLAGIKTAEIQRSQPSTVVEHAGHVGHLARIEVRKVKRSQKGATIEDVGHVGHVGGVQPVEVANLSQIPSQSEPIRHAGDACVVGKRCIEINGDQFLAWPRGIRPCGQFIHSFRACGLLRIVAEGEQSAVGAERSIRLLGTHSSRQSHEGEQEDE